MLCELVVTFAKPWFQRSDINRLVMSRLVSECSDTKATKPVANSVSACMYIVGLSFRINLLIGSIMTF